MAGLRKYTFSTAGENIGLIEETAVRSIWLGAVGHGHAHVLLEREHIQKLISVLQHVEQHGRLPEERADPANAYMELLAELLRTRRLSDAVESDFADRLTQLWNQMSRAEQDTAETLMATHLAPKKGASQDK
jgi:hypothetical protein